MKTITNLAVSSIKENRSRSILIGICIFLTTTLLTVISTCGYGIVHYNLRYVEDIYGKYYATYSRITDNQVNEMKLHAQFLNVGTTSVVAWVENQKAKIVLRFMDENTLTLTNTHMEQGYYPKKENEIAAQKELLQLLGIAEPKLGDTVTVPYRVNGEGSILYQDFEICGIMPSYQENDLASFYQVYISQEFFEEKVVETDRSYTACFQIVNDENLNYDQMKEKIYDLAETIGVMKQNVKLNTSYLIWKLDPSVETLLVCISISLIVILFSILVIYNIFHVGMLQKVREYGKLKAIGATRRQLKRMVIQEGLILSAPCIPFGLFTGFFLSKLIIFVISRNELMQTKGHNINSISLLNVPILAAVALLSLLTVYLSLRKPMKQAANISPIEALRFLEKKKRNQGLRRGKQEVNLISLTLSDILLNRKRTITTILTMGLSAILFVVLANVVGNMNTEYDARLSIEKGQFLIEMDASVHDETYPENNYSYVQQQQLFHKTFLDEIKNIKGVTKIETRKMISARIENMSMKEEEAFSTIAILNKEDFQRLHDNIKRGKADYQAASKEDGVIFHWDAFFDYYGYTLGQDIEFTLFDGSKDIPFRGVLQASGIHGRSDFVMTEDTFQKLGFTNDMTTMVFIYCKKGMEEEVQSSLENLLAGNEHMTLTSYKNALQLSKLSFSMLRSAVYSILAVIGIIGFMNMANTMITSIMTRKRELGVLQAIGMTVAQLNRMLQLEGIIFTAGTLLVALSVGNVFGYLAFQKCKETGMTGLYQYHIPLTELGLMIGAILVLQVILSFVLSRNLQKNTIIDRIRFEE